MVFSSLLHLLSGSWMCDLTSVHQSRGSVLGAKQFEGVGMLVGGLSLQPPACTMPFMPPCSNLEATGAACLPVPSSGRENLAATVGKQLTTTPVARVVRLVVFDDILVWSYQEEKTDENTAKPCVHSVTPCVFGMRVVMGFYCKFNTFAEIIILHVIVGLKLTS